MKFKVDDEEVFELTETRKKVICHDVDVSIIDDDLKRRVSYIVEHKYEQCMKRLANEWMPKLKERVNSVPTDDDDLAELIFSQPDYKDKAQVEQENREKKQQQLNQLKPREMG